nr:MAG TPA: hypothetical protein [Caudoviricetes sp.]
MYKYILKISGYRGACQCDSVTGSCKYVHLRRVLPKLPVTRCR